MQELNEQAVREELFGGPRKRVGRFYLQPVRDDEASEKAGYPVFIDVEYCYVVLRGGAEAKPEDFSYRADEALRAEFAAAYAAFEHALANRRTALELLPSYRPSIGASLHAIGIHHVEGLAAATEGEVEDLTGKKRKIAFPAALDSIRTEARRLLAGMKPRVRMVDGQFREVA